MLLDSLRVRAIQNEINDSQGLKQSITRILSTKVPFRLCFKESRLTLSTITRLKEILTLSPSRNLKKKITKRKSGFANKYFTEN